MAHARWRVAKSLNVEAKRAGRPARIPVEVMVGLDADFDVSLRGLRSACMKHLNGVLDLGGAEALDEALTQAFWSEIEVAMRELANNY